MTPGGLGSFSYELSDFDLCDDDHENETPSHHKQQAQSPQMVQYTQESADDGMEVDNPEGDDSRTSKPLRNAKRARDDDANEQVAHNEPTLKRARLTAEISS
ncbi:MAG: hypothetical protein ACO23B_12075, partial [Burkholderiaceae bacterium]